MYRYAILCNIRYIGHIFKARKSTILRNYLEAERNLRNIVSPFSDGPIKVVTCISYLHQEFEDLY